MTTPTILFGWLLLGLGLAAIGAFFVVMTCSAWSESRARKADGSDEFQASWEQHVADALAKTEESNVVRLQSVPAPVIPIQRDRRGGASRG